LKAKLKINYYEREKAEINFEQDLPELKDNYSTNYNSKSKTAKPAKHSSRYKSKDFTNTPNGKSFGLLTLKNQTDLKNKVEDNYSPTFKTTKLVKHSFTPSDFTNIRKSQDVQLTSSFR
jgi:hypothetical protein